MNTGDSLREFVDGRIGIVLKSKWRLDSLIGIGGMAAVYAATHRNTKRVAVKMLHPDVSSDESIRQRFLREGYAANRVGHPGAVEVFDDDIADDGSAFLVMELLDGENLDRRMRRKGGRLPQIEVLSVAEQVLDTLAAAHDRGIFHRDIKPENVFLTRGGVVKLLDFGIARVLELTGASKATQRGAILGTPAFMPPEQAMAIWEEVDARSDIWALGATVFMLLTGDFVHPAATGIQALDYAVNKRARSVASANATLHPSVVRLVDKSLAFEKASRFQSAREMQEAVRTAYAEIEGHADPRAPQLTLPDEDTPPLQTDSVGTAPAPGYPSEPVPVNAAVPAPRSPSEAEPLSIAARTIVSKRKSQARLRTTAVAIVSAVTVFVVVFLLSRGRSPSTQPATSASAVMAVTGVLPPEPAPPATAASVPSVTPSAAPSASTTVAVPVIAASALPIAREGSAARPPSVVSGPKPRATAVATSVQPEPAPAVTAEPAPKPSAPADPFSGRF